MRKIFFNGFLCLVTLLLSLSCEKQQKTSKRPIEYVNLLIGTAVFSDVLFLKKWRFNYPAIVN